MVPVSTPLGSTCHTSQPRGILFMSRILCSQYFKTYSLVLRATCRFIFLLYNQHHRVFAGWANFFFHHFITFPAPVDFHSNSDLRQPIASQYSQDKPSYLCNNPGYGFDGQRSYDLLYRPGLTWQQQPTTSIPAADSSRAFTMTFNFDEQKLILGRMK